MNTKSAPATSNSPGRVHIRKGLDIPIAGQPEQVIAAGPAVGSVALLGADTLGLKPRIAVAVGDRVREGQVLYEDKQNPGVLYTSPGAGEVVAIHRGARRVLEAVVVRLEGDEHERFDASGTEGLAGLPASAVRAQLVASGLWPAFRTRPYSRVPRADAMPTAIFVTATDTNPLAADPSAVIGAKQELFAAGLTVLARLDAGRIYVCTAPDATIDCPDREPFVHAEFAGPHPAGLPGTHIHFLEPVSERKTVWHVGYQDVIAIGELFTSGRLPTSRVVALTGPMVRRPRLVATRAGASTGDLVRGELEPGRVRIVSGSVLSGHRATGHLAWLGRYQTQVTVLAEGTEREFLSFLRAGTGKFSAARAYAGHLLHRGRFPLTTSQNGSPRAIVPIGSFERVVPLDILPTPLLKALLVKDTDKARALGCLELDEEDLALCSFVCNGKYEYGPYLRMTLDEIEAHG